MNATNVLQSLATWVLWNSSGAAVLILLVLAVRFFAGTAMSARWRSNLWLLVIVRLTIPLLPAISISTPANLAPSTIHIESETTVSVAVIDDGTITPIAATHPTAAAPSISLNWTQILITVWLVGVASLLARLLISSIRLARATRRLQPVDNSKILDLHRACCELMGIANVPPLLASGRHCSPALVGVLRPKILLPHSIESQLTLDEIRTVLLHELAHLRRRDILQKYLVAFLTALHWFNPFLWIANSRIAADREFACDEAVLRITSRQNGRDYGRILLKLVEMMNANRLPAGAVGVVNRTSLVQRRIDMIASYASRTGRHSALVRSAAAALVLIAGVTAMRAQTVTAVAPPTSQEDSSNTRTYDVRPLLVEIPSFEMVTAPAVAVEKAPAKSDKVGGDAPIAVDREKLARQLESWLKATVGNEAKLSLSASDGKLVVVAEPATQTRIAHLLEQVESRRAVQATIETRALTFPAFPKLNPDLTDKIRISLAPGGSPMELSEYELSQLMHALEQSPTGSVITAPRITLFDGQRSHVVVATTKAYSASKVELEDARSIEVTSPGVLNLTTGTTVSIRPSVDADHVHIALDFDFASSHLVAPKTEVARDKKSVTVPAVEKVHVNRTLSTSTGHTLLMNLDPAADADGRLRILLVRPMVIVTKIDPIRS